MIAHIVGPGAPPLYAFWLASLTAFGGAITAVVWWRRRTPRRASLGLALAGLVATAGLLVAQPAVPQRPGYGITLAGARDATTPVLLHVCAVPGGAAARVPGNRQLLLVSVDGHQVAEVHADTVAVPMPPGLHRVTAQLITSDHRAFQPPITTESTVTVTGPGPVPTAAACKR